MKMAKKQILQVNLLAKVSEKTSDLSQILSWKSKINKSIKLKTDLSLVITFYFRMKVLLMKLGVSLFL